jgi:two-component SAPR family response regulator
MLTQDAKRLKILKSQIGKAAQAAKKAFREEQQANELMAKAQQEFGVILESVGDLKKLKAEYDKLKKAKK